MWDLWSYFRHVSGNYTTIPQLFRQHGYSTQGQGKIFHCGHASGASAADHCGDDLPLSWDSYVHVEDEPYPLDSYGGPFSWFAVNASMVEKYPLPDTQIATSAIAQIAKERIKADEAQRAGTVSKPFFIAAGT